MVVVVVVGVVVHVSGQLGWEGICGAVGERHSEEGLGHVRGGLGARWLLVHAVGRWLR